MKCVKTPTSVNSTGHTDGADGYKAPVKTKTKTCTTGAITASGQCVKATPAKPKAKLPTTQTQTDDASADVPDIVSASSSSDPAPVASPISYGTVKHTDPRGDIIVVSYVNAPGEADNHRLGGLGVKIARQGGDADCLTHKNGKSSTSQQKDRPGHSKTHGLVHFLNCKAGDYTATATDRPGYVTLGKKVKTFHLSNKEKQIVPFTMQKVNTGGAAAN